MYNYIFLIKLFIFIRSHRILKQYYFLLKNKNLNIFFRKTKKSNYDSYFISIDLWSSVINHYAVFILYIEIHLSANCPLAILWDGMFCWSKKKNHLADAILLILFYTATCPYRWPGALGRNYRAHEIIERKNYIIFIWHTHGH